MALIACPECQKQISTESVSCPGCGAPTTNAAKIKSKYFETLGLWAVGAGIGALIMPFFVSVVLTLLAFVIGIWAFSRKQIFAGSLAFLLAVAAMSNWTA